LAVQTSNSSHFTIESQLPTPVQLTATAAAGDLLAHLAPSFTTARVLPGIRPIQVGELATRIAIGAAYTKHRGAILAAFPDIQLGLGVPGGCEAFP
jgi:hypothetical protein